MQLEKKDTQFGSSNVIDYHKVNENLLAQILCTFPLIMQIFQLPNYRFFNCEFFQSCSIITCKV